MALASPTPTSAHDLSNALDLSAGEAQKDQDVSIDTFLGSVAATAIIFAIEIVFFFILKNKFSRIYLPKTYLVPERQRTHAPGAGLISWIMPVFRTSNSEFITKCGLDAYFFLRYLRMLLKIVVPLALLILPILLPLNNIGGSGKANGHTGMDALSWGNLVGTKHTQRYWAHLVLAVVVVAWVCYVVFRELRGYIRLRQAYLTSPQHRLRASATTVLVTSIPHKWLSVEALDGLYDVFPGGLRNIWLNRDFSELSAKVEMRDKLAKMLESAETNLIKDCKKAQLKMLAAERKKGNLSKEDKEYQEKMDEAKVEQAASSAGVSSGNPHQVHHTLQDEANDADLSTEEEEGRGRRLPGIPIKELGSGFQAVGKGFDKFGKKLLGGIKGVGQDVEGALPQNGGFVADSPSEMGLDSRRLDDRPEVPRKDTRYNSSSDSQSPPDQSEVHPALRTLARGRPETPRDQNLDGAADSKETPGLPVTGLHNQNQGALREVGGVYREPTVHQPRPAWQIWKQGGREVLPSPNPHGRVREDDEKPLKDSSLSTRKASVDEKPAGKKKGGFPFFKSKEGVQDAVESYPKAFNEEFDGDTFGDPSWKKYVKAKDRPTIRLPVFGIQWLWFLHFIGLGKKVDAIYYCRRELARFNLEIEEDQQDPEKYPLMNSAFVQFNHQVAAHMACQAVSHHVPLQMAPRHLEVSPDDVIWENMRVRWWERYVRTFIVIALVVSMIVGWAFPVAFVGLISQVSFLTAQFKWLSWIDKIPRIVVSIVSGVLPPALLAALLALLPIVLRYLSRQQGLHTGMTVELQVQNYFFAFLFIQVFLVVSLSSGLTRAVNQIIHNPTYTPTLLAENLPLASNFFFSYMLLQAFSVSGGALVQIGSLISWFILSPIMDSTAREKFNRQTNLPQMQWGTFFPVYTNLAAIGLVYSVISPLMLVFNIMTFSLFWFVYRYNLLYVTKFRFDTGGLLFPRAINQLFVGLYVMEICLVGLFAGVTDDNLKHTCIPQTGIMVAVLFLTGGFQILLNYAFSPLFRYLPITLEDDAVARDEEFERSQAERWKMVPEEQDGQDINDVLAAREHREQDEDARDEEIELEEIQERKKHHGRAHGMLHPRSVLSKTRKRGSWADRSSDQNGRVKDFGSYPRRPRDSGTSGHDHIRKRHLPTKDLESQATNPAQPRAEYALFSGMNDEIEDLTPDERDKLVQRAFQHEALRAKRPVIWIPRDDLGVSDDEVYRTQQLSKHIWISNAYAGLDTKARVIYRRSPPDFSEIDLIEL